MEKDLGGGGREGVVVDGAGVKRERMTWLLHRGVTAGYWERNVKFFMNDE